MRIHREPRHLFSPRKSRKDEAGLTTYKVDQIGYHPVNLVIQKSNERPSSSKEKPTTAEIVSPAVKSTMTCDGPQSRLTKSTGAAIATGSLRRFIGWSLKRRLMAVSRKFSLGSCNQWAISKETPLRISRKYSLPFKKRTNEGSPPFANRPRPRRRSRPRPLVTLL